MSEVPKTCVNCRFYNRKGSNAVRANWRGDVHEGYKEVELQLVAPLPTDRKRCLKIEHGDGLTSNSPADAEQSLAFLSDGSGYAAGMWVSPNFGCVLFEQREIKESC